MYSECIYFFKFYISLRDGNAQDVSFCRAGLGCEESHATDESSAAVRMSSPVGGAQAAGRAIGRVWLNNKTLFLFYFFCLFFFRGVFVFTLVFSTTHATVPEETTRERLHASEGHHGTPPPPPPLPSSSFLPSPLPPRCVFRVTDLQYRCVQ